MLAIPVLRRMLQREEAFEEAVRECFDSLGVVLENELGFGYKPVDSNGMDSAAIITPALGYPNTCVEADA